MPSLADAQAARDLAATSAVTLSGSNNNVAPTPGAANVSLSLTKIISAASTNGANLKATSGRLYKALLQNTTAAWKFVKFYNKATAPVVGTDTPVITLGIPPNGILNMDPIYPFTFSTGISIAITGASPDADATATAVGDVIGAIGYV